MFEGFTNGRALVRLTLILALAGAAALAFYARAGVNVPARPGVRRVVDRWDLTRAQGREEPQPPARDAPARYRWDRAAIARDWARTASGASITLRSPLLEVERDALHAIVISLGPVRSEDRGVLLWNLQPTLSRSDYLRNRRDLTPLTDHPTTVVVRGKDLRADNGDSPRYLFLHLPGAGAAAWIESIAVVTTADLGVTAPRRGRLAFDGEVRDVTITRPGRLSFRTDVPANAVVALGVRAGTDAGAARVRVTVGAGAASRTLVDEPIAGGRWRDYTVPLAAGRGVDVRFSVEASEGETTAVAWSTPVLLAPDAGVERPNVVLYVMDALRADRLGLYGAESPRPVSPQIDRLGREGLTFTRAYAAASWTKPSIASLLTSLHPQTHGLGARYYTDALPDSVATLQGALGAHGYLTAQFTANPFAGTLSNLDRGFDVAFMPDALVEAPPSGDRRKPTSDDLSARILPWIDRHRDEQFFVYVQSIDTHPPFIAPVSGGADDPRSRYDAAIASSDQGLGRLVARLRELGLAERTIVVVTADHGEAFGEHGGAGHGQSVYDEEIRVPLVVSWPGHIAPRVVDEPVSLVDLAPTILDYCAIPADASFQGVSARPASGSQPSSRPVVSTRFVYPEDLDAADLDRAERRAVVDYPWKLIVTDRPDAAPRIELYNLRDDPGERTDRHEDEPAWVRRLSEGLEGFLREQAAARARFVEGHGVAGAPVRTGAPGNRILPSTEVMEQLKSLGYVY